jgi:glucosamine--fructose-6-phosphate aminotransferase (isomerizing)
MCGIVGILGNRDVALPILEGLRRLEYRGYDSAGIATLVGGEIVCRRTVGKLKVLEESLAADPLPGKTGIGHTRWATHGAPVEKNAHPHFTEGAAIVHNGIIENFAALRDSLRADGHVFRSETDSEVIAHALTRQVARLRDPVAAFEAMLKELEGAFAIAAIVKGEEDLLLGARRGSPLALAGENGEAFLGSDAIALAAYARQVVYLEDGDWVALSRSGREIRDETGARVQRTPQDVVASAVLAGKGEYRHFMAKEIHEQPTVAGHTVGAYADAGEAKLKAPALPFDWKSIPRLTIVGCGTAFYAGLVGKYWFEEIARLPVEVDIASEFRYREAPCEPGGAALFISQSGETADTLAALRYCKTAGAKTIGIVNVPDSTIAREADAIVPTKAGVEIGVASTKAFTSQLVVLATLALAAAKARGHLSARAEADAIQELLEVPRLMAEALQNEPAIADIAHDLAKVRHTLFLGRGRLYPLALEGALKLKEISYIHAEGYPGGELKHGPLALVDEEMPIVALAPSGPLFEKMASNVKEVVARGGRIILVSDRKGIDQLGDDADWIIEVPEAPALIAPLVYAIPMQLLAYHTAVAKGTDVDQPRNLAKSVTVE